MFLFSLLVAHAMASADCTVTQVLQNPKDAACVQELIKKIPDEQDRAEFKFKLTQWKPKAGFKVYAAPGFIEAQSGGKLLFRAIWLQRLNPAILWLDGKILTDKSNNPSVARTLDNLFRTK